MFQSARLKLTFWYAAIILLINLTISSLIYYRTSILLNHEFNRIQNRLEEERRQFGVSIQKQLHEKLALENLEKTKENLLTQLFIINAGITSLVVIFGYILSSKTLAPIAETVHLQEQFIGDASHELKTPLTSLQTSLEVNLADKTLSKKARAILQENLDDVTQLITLTERLLQLAKPANEQDIELHPIELQETIATALKKARQLAEKKDITLKQTGTTAKMFVKADQALLTELCIILLDNAIKYSEPKKTVTVQTVASSRHVTISCIDEGIGIAAKDLDKIFDRFYQVSNSRTRSVTSSQSKGYGLGLSLAQRIAELHHSQLSVQSTPNVGTKISFYLYREASKK